MNIEQWLIKFYEAYELVGVNLTIDKRNFLMSILDDNKPLREKEDKLINEAIEILTRYFFKLSINSQTFGNEQRIKENFGKSIEENYKISSGYFLSLAKTFWTFHFEIHDLFPTHHNKILTQVLRTIEGNISTVFFPMPETITFITVEQRASAQTEMLLKYAPDVDIEKFIKENPLLEIDKKKQETRKLKIQTADGSISEAEPITSSNSITKDETISVGWNLKYRSRRRLVLGLLCLFGGMIATIISFSQAKAGGYYLIFYGFMFFGVITLIRAAVDFSRSEKILSSLQMYDSLAVSNTSGQGKLALVPKEIQKWNWGAFLLTFIWGISNKVWRTFLVFVPVFNIAYPFILGAKGSTWAWQNKVWRDVKHFRNVQKSWAIAGFIVSVFYIFFIIIGIIIEE